MGLSWSRHHGVYISRDVAPQQLSREQIQMIEKYLPDFPIYEPSTEHHRQLAASHWDAVFKEQRRSIYRNSLRVLLANRRESESANSVSRLTMLFDAFYVYIEQHSPELKPLFHSSLQVKSKVLVHVSAGMRSLLASDHVIENMVDLTKTHIRIGVKLEHFNPLGNALLHAMKTVSGELWTPEYADAWRRLFAHCSAMLLVIHKSTSS